MKKLFILFALTSVLFSCKKETTNTNSATNTSNGVTCVDNPNINFNSIGTPVGKFSDCIKDVDGNVYKTVTIGTQTWMAENLKTSKYNDGTSIPNVKDSLEWSKLTTGAWCYYNNDENNNTKYGKLYNWYTVNSTSNGNKNVCPTGWHVPTDDEFEKLIHFLDKNSKLENYNSFVGGAYMKELGTTSWKNTSEDVNNNSLFSGLPGGGRSDAVGNFVNLKFNGYWWTSTIDETNLAWMRSLDDGNIKVYRESQNYKSGLSIRCVKD